MGAGRRGRGGRAQRRSAAVPARRSRDRCARGAQRAPAAGARSEPFRGDRRLPAASPCTRGFDRCDTATRANAGASSASARRVRGGGRWRLVMIAEPAHLEQMLGRLKLTAIRDQLDSLLDEAAKRELTLRETLTMFCEREIARKDERRIEMAFGLAKLRLLIVDELGYLPFEPDAALFQLVSRRYERGSVLITSNRAIGEWGTVFGDPVVATAILDRLLHHSHVVTIRGDSYRLREKRRSGLLKAAAPALQ